jgi:hypothetical protein
MYLKDWIEQQMDELPTLVPAEIIAINGSFADCQPIAYQREEDKVVVSNCPILSLGNNDIRMSFNYKVGDIVPLLFASMELGDWLEQSTKGVTTYKSNRATEAIVLPFHFFNKSTATPIPTSIKIEGDLEMIGNLSVIGDVTIEGAVSVTGTITATDNIESDTDVIGGGISLKNHTHDTPITSGSSSGTWTSTPPN